MNDDWYIYLNTYLLEEKIYNNIAKGDVLEYSLEFSHRHFIQSQSNKKYAEVANDLFVYNINAEVVYYEYDTCIIDFGINAYAYSLNMPELVVPGSFTEGMSVLLVDDYGYEDVISKYAGMPPLIYTWEIVGIYKLKGYFDGAKEEIHSTDYKNDNIGSYILECKLADNKAKYPWEKTCK